MSAPNPESVRVRRCDVCGAVADGRARVDAADGPILGHLCDAHAEDMAALLDEWEPFEASQIDGSGDKNPNQGRGVDLDRTEGDGAPRSAADAGIGGSHDGSDGRVGHDHAGAASELKPATDGDRASDPPGANPAQIDGSGGER